MKTVINKLYEVATFESDTANAEVIEGSLSLNNAIRIAKKLRSTSLHYGVMVRSQESEDINPIIWIKTNKLN